MNDIYWTIGAKLQGDVARWYHVNVERVYSSDNTYQVSGRGMMCTYVVNNARPDVVIAKDDDNENDVVLIKGDPEDWNCEEETIEWNDWRYKMGCIIKYRLPPREYPCDWDNLLDDIIRTVESMQSKLRTLPITCARNVSAIMDKAYGINGDLSRVDIALRNCIITQREANCNTV